MTGETTRVSVASDGTEGNRHESWSSISADGRYVAFDSFSNNLVPGDANGAFDIFVYDLVAGTTELVSVNSDAMQGNDHSFRPSISGDGRYVAYYSAATNLIGLDTNGVVDVFVRDREAGTTARVSVSSSGSQSGGGGRDGVISADGRYVAFYSAADDLATEQVVGNLDIFVHDIATGTTELVSVSSNRIQGNSDSLHPAISADGRYVVFASAATNLVDGDIGYLDVFVHDRLTGQTTRISERAPGVQANGASGGVYGPPSVSGDGMSVAFESYATNLIPEDTNSHYDIFVRDLGEPETAPNVDLSISDIIPIQAVEHPQVDTGDTDDLVHDKPMVVRVEVQIDPPSGLLPTDEVTVRLDFQGVWHDQTRTVQEIVENSSFIDFPEAAGYFLPGPLGEAEIVAVVDPPNGSPLGLVPEFDETNNQRSQRVTVKATRGLSLVYVQVEFEGKLPQDLNLTVANADKFIEWVYPIPQLNARVAPFLQNSLMSTCSNLPICRMDFLADVMQIWLRTKILFPTSSDRIVAVVPQEYVSRLFDQCGPLGTQVGDVVFVAGGQSTGVAHELGHSYGLGKPEEYGDPVPLGNCEFDHVPDGPPASGFNVQEREPVLGEDVVCFMGVSPGLGPEEDIRKRWVAPHNYTALFSHEDFLVDSADPMVLLISGRISVDGIVEMGPMYLLEKGLPRTWLEGDYSLLFQDVQRGVIGSTQFDVDFVLERDPLLPEETDESVFLIAVEYPEEAEFIEIRFGGESLEQVAIGPNLLHTAVDAVPDGGFSANPDQRRNALHNKISAFETQIRDGDMHGASSKLKYDLRPSVERWLVDAYQPSDVLQYSREELLELIDRLILRLELEVDLSMGT